MKITVELINRLKGLSTGHLQPFDDNWGICNDLFKRYGIDWAELYPYFVKWSKYSGILEYPVPSTDPKLDAREAFYERSNIWGNTEYGYLRKELCLFLSVEFEQELLRV